MNVTQSIQTNPDKALELFAQLSGSSDGSVKTRERLLRELKAEIEFYAQVEETHLLAALRKHKDTKGLATEAAADHCQVRKLIGAMEQMPKNSPEFLGQVNELRQAFEQHVSNEKKQILPALKKALSDKQMQGLAHDMKAGRADAYGERRENAKQSRAAAREERAEKQQQAQAEATQRPAEQDERAKQEQEQAEQRLAAAREEQAEQQRQAQAEATQRQAEQDERAKQGQEKQEQEHAEQSRAAAREEQAEQQRQAQAEATQRQAEQDERARQEQAERQRQAQAKRDERAKQEEAEQRLIAANEKREQSGRQEAASAGGGLGLLSEYGQLWVDFASTTAASTARASSAVSRCHTPAQLAQTQLLYATEIGQAWMEAGNRMVEVSLRSTSRW